MTSEEVFCDLSDKYGEDFNWEMIPFTKSNSVFVDELKREIGKEHFLYDKKVWAVARCTSNDDVLYVTADGSGGEIYYIIHLTYSENNIDGFPRCKEFESIYAVKDFIEQSFIPASNESSRRACTHI